MKREWINLFHPRIDSEMSIMKSPHGLGSAKTGSEMNVMTPIDEIENQAEISRNEAGLKIWTCRVCGHIFKHKYNFIKHYRTHTGEKPFACPYCPYRSNQNSNLQCHVLSRHKEHIGNEFH